MNGGIRFDKPLVGNVYYQRYPVGRVASYYCNDGYIHSGALGAICRFQGWNSINGRPVCTGIINSRLF